LKINGLDTETKQLEAEKAAIKQRCSIFYWPGSRNVAFLEVLLHSDLSPKFG
jgi:hypothetical protein